MLEDAEWDEIEPLLRRTPESDDPTNWRTAALERYQAITGLKETNKAAIWHHRLDIYGPPCRVCRKPLRTPRASWCAACGARAHRVTDSTSPRSILATDKDWSRVADRICEVTEFVPHARVENNKVVRDSISLPLALIRLDCRERGIDVSPNTFGAVFHKEDFRHLWEAIVERPRRLDEIICVVWSKRRLTGVAKLCSPFMPRLAIVAFTSESYELHSNSDYRQSLGGEQRLLAELPTHLWQPAVWREPIVPTVRPSL